MNKSTVQNKYFDQSGVLKSSETSFLYSTVNCLNRLGHLPRFILPYSLTWSHGSLLFYGCRKYIVLYQYISLANTRIFWKDGRTPLHLAALNGDFKTIQLLISEKANIDATDKVCIEKDTQEHTTFFKYITIDVFVCCIIVMPVTFLYQKPPLFLNQIKTLTYY